jgi:hypothetical protein
MEYRVVTFLPTVDRSEGAAGAAKQLEELINSHAGQRWKFQGLENVEMVVTTAGSSGCMGFGAVPPTSQVTTYNMAVFYSE